MLKPDGTVTRRTEFTYDGPGNRTGFTAFNGPGLIRTRYENKYDSKDGLIEMLDRGRERPFDKVRIPL